jgi:hypothetical protein
MSDPITPDSLQIARLEAQFTFMRAAMEEMANRQRDAMAAMADGQRETQRQLAEMRSELEQAKGGWRTLMWLGGAAMSAGAGISWVLSHVRVQ